MQLQDLGKMGQVVLSNIVPVIVYHVVNGCWAPSVVERLAVIGQNNNRLSARLQHPLPLVQSFNRIGNMLQAMCCQKEVVSIIRNSSQLNSFGYIIHSSRLMLVKHVRPALFPGSLPNGFCREYDVVQRLDVTINRQDPAIREDAAWPSDFQSTLPDNGIP